MFNKPIDDSPAIQQLEALSLLIEFRTIQISSSQHSINKVRCYPDLETNLIYFLKHEAPLIGSCFTHPVSRMPSAVISHISQAGRIAISFESFESSVDFFTCRTSFDRNRWKSFTTLTATNWNTVPATLNAAESTVMLPLSYKPDAGDVFLFNNSKHYKIINLLEKESFNLCQVVALEMSL